MPTRAEIYWEGMLLAPLGARTERERRAAQTRVCSVCEGRLFLTEPTVVAIGSDTIGHDSDCEALAMFLEDIGSGNGGGGSTGGSVDLSRTDITLGTAGITLATLSD